MSKATPATELPPAVPASPLLLAFVSGYIDAAVFVALGGLFVAHVTGNFVLLGAAIAGTSVTGHGGSTTLQLVSFPIFFAGAFLAALVARHRAGSSTVALLWMTAIIVAAAAIPTLIMPGYEAPQAMGFAFAMGVLNAAHRLDSSLGPPFTVMTGNVTALAVRAAGAGPAQAKGAAPAMAILVLGFAAGCVLGAIAQDLFGLAAMLFPACLLSIRLLIR
ncbi:MAG: YoaK family protein [Sphingopyxis sp.]|nr:YoaK family protein [Sphingopyxis sp.]